MRTQPFVGSRVVAGFAQHFSTNIALRPVSQDDAWPLWLCTRNERFNANLLWARPDSPSGAVDLLAGYMKRMQSESAVHVALVLRDTGEWFGLGRAELSSRFDLSDSIEHGIWVAPRFWSRGLAREAISLLVDASFLTLGASTVCGGIAAANGPARKMMDSLGFRVTGTHAITRDDGRSWAGVNIGQERAEWASRPLTTLLPLDGALSA